MQSFLANPYVTTALALALAGIALSGRLSVTLARVFITAALVVGTYGVITSKLTRPQAIAAVFVLWLVMGALVMWARPTLLPANVGRLDAPRTIWSVLNPSVTFEIGDSGTEIDWRGGSNPIFAFFKQDTLTVEQAKGRVFVSTRIRDRSGAIVAEMFRNEWKVSSRAYDRNYDKTSLEVINSEGDVVLQVQALPNKVRIQGEWWGPGEGVRLLSGRPFGYHGAYIIKISPKNTRPDVKIKRRFKYPSELHFGELEG